MTIDISKYKASNHWYTLKSLDYDTKLDIIAMLTQSLKQKDSHKNFSAKTFYGIWPDDGMSADEFVDELKKERSFNQDIVTL